MVKLRLGEEAREEIDRNSQLAKEFEGGNVAEPEAKEEKKETVEKRLRQRRQWEGRDKGENH